MKIAVTTPSGHVGGAVADHLLEAGADVRLMARRPEKLRRFVELGAEVVRGSQDDQDYVNWMTEGADALFWVTPPGYGSDDLRAYQNRIGHVGAEAIRLNKIPRVVNLSAIGAQHASGCGPINGLHDVEHLLSEVATNILHLRPGFFFENYLWQVDAIRQYKSIFMPVSGKRRYPMLATCDIGRVAAEWLLDEKWTGFWIKELHGPIDLSFDDAARAISEGLHREITHVKVAPEQARQSMLESGMSENASDSMLELYEAVENATLKPAEPRTPETTTRTALAEFAEEVIAPLIAEPIGRV